MAFTDEQRQELQAKLSYRHVKTRHSNGVTLSYVEGWHVIAEANRIFGFGNWDRKTVAPRCVWSNVQRTQTACLYTAKVRITVRAGAVMITRDGIGTGSGSSPSPELAHEMALKAAETDATKRALATFGNPFGLALYDKEMLQVTRSRSKTAAAIREDERGSGDPFSGFILARGDGRDERFVEAEAYVGAVLKFVPTLPTIESLYAFWEANVESLGALRARAESPDRDPVPAIISVLKARARMLGLPRKSDDGGSSSSGAEEASRPAIPKEKRLRSKAHLAFVAKQPCLVCGRRPSHAHHLRFAQPRAMALKVSDEFTVPLCSGHHDSLHRTGDERAWWARHGIVDPLQMAARLWSASRLSVANDDEDDVVPSVETSSEPEKLDDNSA